MSDKIFSKKAQATIFIIIGIILLITVSLVVVFRAQIRDVISQSGTGFVATEMPVEFQKVSSYVDACLYSTSIDGLRILGEHGGYINPVASGMSVKSNPLVTEGSAVNLMSDVNLPVPYWYYLSSPNDCTGNCAFSNGMPGLRKDEGSPNIESELESYINLNLASCLTDFKALKDEGYIFSDEIKPASTVTVREGDILITLDYSFKVSYGSNTHQFNLFSSTVPLNLERVYNLAKRLTEYEAQYHYLEKHTANLIVGYSGLDKEIPPFSDVTLEFGNEKTWQKDRIKENLIMVMESNTPLFQVENTMNYRPRITGSATKDALYNRGTNIPNNFSTEDMNVYFSYYAAPNGWDPYFDLNCRGNTCGPLSISSNLIALIGIQRYKFFYDLSYPVLVEVNSPNELVNEIPNGYRFKFFLESNLRDNAPLLSDYEKQIQADVGRTLFCDDDKRNSGNITVNVSDGITGAPIEDASIVYSCGTDTCVVGKTGTKGYLVSRFPVCFGGIISIVKTDYSQLSLPFNINLDQSKKASYSINPVIEKTISLEKKMMEKTSSGWSLGNTILPLDQNEEAYIIFNKIAGPSDVAYSAFVYLNSTTQEAPVNLGPGEYMVEVNLILNEQVNIPKKQIMLGEDIPGMQLNETPSGGLKMNITITPEQLKKDHITLTAIGFDPRQFSSVDDLNVLGFIDPYSITFSDELQPRYT